MKSLLTIKKKATHQETAWKKAIVLRIVSAQKKSYNVTAKQIRLVAIHLVIVWAVTLTKIRLVARHLMIALGVTLTRIRLVGTHLTISWVATLTKIPSVAKPI